MLDPIEPPATDAAVPRPPWLMIGAAMIALGAWRGFHDAVALARYVPVNAGQIVTAPAYTPWLEFAGVLWGAWPIALGVALIVARSPRLLRPAAITSFALAAERGATLAAGVALDSTMLTSRFGRNASLPPPLSRFEAASAFFAAVVWLVVGLLAASAESRWKRADADPAPPRAARRRGNRLAGFVSGLFALAILGVTTWTTYLESVDRLPVVRKLVLGETPSGPRFAPRPDTPEEKRFREANRLLAEGQRLQNQGEFRAARTAYLKAVNRFEALRDEAPTDGDLARRFAYSANNLAWFLATCEDPAARDPESAVALARKAVAIDPTDGNSLNTLGAALFRAGELEEAVRTFEKSMELRRGGDSFDWYFLAMIESDRRRAPEALAFYRKAAEWNESDRPHDPELHRFRAEAAERLGLPKPAPPRPRPPRGEPGSEPIVGNVPGMLRGEGRLPGPRRPPSSAKERRPR